MQTKILVCFTLALLVLPLNSQWDAVDNADVNQNQPVDANQNAGLQPNVNPNPVENNNVTDAVVVIPGENGDQNEIVVPPVEQAATQPEAAPASVEAANPVQDNVITQNAVQNLQESLNANQANAENQAMVHLPATQFLSMLMNASNGTLSLVGLQVLAAELRQGAADKIDVNDHKYLDLSTGVLFSLNQYQEALIHQNIPAADMEPQAPAEEQQTEVPAEEQPQVEVPVVAPEAQPQAEIPVVAPEVTVVTPEAQPQAEVQVVSPEAQPQAEVPVVAPEEQPQAEAQVVSPEAQPQADVTVVSPEAQPQEEVPVVAPEAQPQEEVPVVAPEAQNQAEVPVVVPEAQPQAQENVVAPENATVVPAENNANQPEVVPATG